VIGSDDRQFFAMSEQQCRDLLRQRNVGRVGWQAADGPQILPVNYVWHDETVIFRTSPYGLLSELIRPTDVVLEIDELDLDHHSGWSVTVHGRAEAVAEPAEVSTLWGVENLVPWAPGVRNLFIRIVPRRVTGRTLSRNRPDREFERDRL
jgi:uncharacterized protein